MTRLPLTQWRERSYHIRMTILCGAQGAAEDLFGVLGTGELYQNLAETRHPNA